jgi:hypothetical protein
LVQQDKGKKGEEMKGRGANPRKNKRSPLLSKSKKNMEEDNMSQGA